MTKYSAMVNITVGSQFVESIYYPSFPMGGQNRIINLDFESVDDEDGNILNDMSKEISKTLGRDDWHLWYWSINKYETI